MEPIHLEVYKCPICNEGLYRGLAKAQEHVNTLISSGLIIPKGLVIKILGEEEVCSILNFKSMPVYAIFLHSRMVDSWERVRIRDFEPHQYCYDRECYTSDMKLFLNDFVYSNPIVKEFKRGNYQLISEKELKRIKNERVIKNKKNYPKYYPKNNELIRTTRELEEWISREVK